MEVEKENQNGNEMEINETKNEPKVEITEEQKDETKDLVGHGGQGKRTFRPRTNPKLGQQPDCLSRIGMSHQILISIKFYFTI